MAPEEEAMPNGSGSKTIMDVRELAQRYRVILSSTEARGPYVGFVNEHNHLVTNLSFGELHKLIDYLAAMEPEHARSRRRTPSRRTL